MLTSAALVLLMVPGLALFYGGMVRRKNVLATFQQSFVMLGVISLQWVLFGYSLAFGPDVFHGLIGGLNFVGLRGVGLDPDPTYAATIPHHAYRRIHAGQPMPGVFVVGHDVPTVSAIDDLLLLAE